MDKNIDHEHEFDGKQDRNFHQKPFDDVTDSLPQIDDASASLAENGGQKTGSEDKSAASDTTDPGVSASDGKVNEINEDDNRDQSDSTTDWDAPGNRTERRK